MHMLPQCSLVMWISLRPLKSTLLQMYLKSLCWDGGCSAVITCITEKKSKDHKLTWLQSVGEKVLSLYENSVMGNLHYSTRSLSTPCLHSSE